MISESRATRITPDGTRTPITRPLAIEHPVAIEFNGIGYAVMMMTPADLADFATGFALAERLIERAEQVRGCDVHEGERGTVLRVTLALDDPARLLDRVRHRANESSCGLCGIENLEQAIRPLPRVTSESLAEPAAIFRALSYLRAHQPLQEATGAVHAAALCAADGSILLAREDVGRHNAMDKLTGAMARAGLGWDGGFALISARCSFELVEKAALANCPMLVAISAPTSFAVSRAQEAGLRLVALARGDSVLEF